MHPLHKLQVYAQAVELARACYTHAQQISDRDLRSQLMRSVRSIAANLAEGAGSDSQATFARYIGIAIASTRETRCHLGFTRDAGFLSDPQYRELTNALDNLAPRLFKLHAAVRRNARRRTGSVP